jgi:hypothetical protein
MAIALWTIAFETLNSWLSISVICSKTYTGLWTAVSHHDTQTSGLAKHSIDLKRASPEKSQLQYSDTDEVRESVVTTSSHADNEATSDDDDDDDDDDFSDDGANDYNDNSQTSGIALLNSATDIIDKLFKVAMQIRNPTTRNTSSKAKSYKSIDPDSGIDLFEAFTKFDEQHVEELFLSYRSSPAPSDDNSKYEKTTQRLTREEKALVSRFARANTNRRRTFGYWRRHEEKRRAEPVPSNPFPSNTMTNKFSIPTTVTALPSGIHGLRLDDQKSAASVQTYVPRPSASDDDTVEVPDVPKDLHGKKEFSCPYCFMLCSEKMLKGNRWRSVIIERSLNRSYRSFS